MWCLLQIAYNSNQVQFAGGGMNMYMDGTSGSRVQITDGPYAFGMYQTAIKPWGTIGAVTASYVSFSACSSKSAHDLATLFAQFWLQAVPCLMNVAHVSDVFGC